MRWLLMSTVKHRNNICSRNGLCTFLSRIPHPRKIYFLNTGFLAVRLDKVCSKT